MGKLAEYRATERRAGIRGPSRKRRSHRRQYREGSQDRGLVFGGATEEVKKDKNSLNHHKKESDLTEEHPVYGKLLQKVLATLGLTEQQWRTKFLSEH
ncbi:hypothetical protein DHEL01_v203860 [Diaporthe helianthi]|uniref:Uncharacterized protein n=1 Tax=Diaporthe helianthi TaxID=158607 RepID=A0A2P5I5F4_DIAHE|nr:hypothetical protein DHEL01_v203860 [Diaporthe helianthi]